MASRRSAAVDAYLDALVHEHLAGIRALRLAILEADPRLVERIKWNAPSFAIDGVDLVTMRVVPRDAFQLVLHRGVAKQADAVMIDDPEGLLDWRAPDRAVVDLTRADPVAVVALVRAWLS